MKKLFLFSIIVFAINFSFSSASAKELTDILRIYKRVAIPYLDRISKNEYSSSSLEDQNFIRSKMNLLYAYVDLINKEVVDEVNEKHIAISETKTIKGIIDLKYKKYFKDLPPAFYTEVTTELGK